MNECTLNRKLLHSHTLTHRQTVNTDTDRTERSSDGCLLLDQGKMCPEHMKFPEA